MERKKLGLQSRLDEVNGRIEVVEYLGARVNSKFKCLDCGKEWKELGYNIVKKPYCPNCKNKGIIIKQYVKIKKINDK